MRRLLLQTVFAAAWLAAKAAVAAATAPVIDVKIVGVDGPVRDNVAAFLSLKRYAGSTDLDQDRVDRLTLRARQEAADALKPFGYYEAEVIVTVTPVDAGWKAVVAIVPGEPVTLATRRYRSPAPEGTSRSWPKSLPPRPWSSASAEPRGLRPVKGELQRVAASNGYLDATWSRAELRVDVGNHAAHRAPHARHGAALSLRRHDDRAGLPRSGRSCGDTCGTRRATGTTRTCCCGPSSRWTTPTTSRWSRCSRTSATGRHSRYRSASTRRRTTATATSSARDMPRTPSGGCCSVDQQAGQPPRHRLSAEATLSKAGADARLRYIIPWDDPALEKLSFRLLAGTVENGDIETRAAPSGPA